MSFYAKLYKSQEAARERNRREQRRSDSFKFGTEYMAKHQLAALEKERRLVEKDFGRIRYEIENSPQLDLSEDNLFSAVTRNTISHDTHAHSDVYEHDESVGFRNENVLQTERTDDGGFTPNEIELSDTIVFFKNNPSVLIPILTANGKSRDYLEGKTEPPEQSNPNKNSDGYVPFYLRPNYNPSFGNARTETVKRYAILLRPNTPRGYIRGKHGKLERNRNQDILTLSRGGMTSARDNINARLGGDGDQESHDRSDAPRPKMTKANAPSNQNYDAERYNADGTLRTCHNLPSDDDRWKEARKAHYIRKNEPPGSDKLNIDDIFAKD